MELLFALEMMEELSSVDESTASQSDSEARQGKCGTRTRTSSNAVELIAMEALSSSTSWSVRVELRFNISTAKSFAFGWFMASLPALCRVLITFPNKLGVNAD